jgi:hypothetical protein
MSTIKVNTITGIIDMPKDVRIKGGRLGVNFTVDSLGALPDSTSGDSFRPSAGDWFWDSPNTTLKLYLNDSHGWKNIGLTDSAVEINNYFIDWGGNRAVYFGGQEPSVNLTNIEYWTISTNSNAQDFGDLTAYQFNNAACSNNTRGLCIGGWSGGPTSNTIEYVTIASPGNATDFGNLTETAAYCTAVSNGTKALINIGYNGSYTPHVDYINDIDTTSNASNWGDGPTVGYGDPLNRVGGVNDDTYAVFGGGQPGSTNSATTRMFYFTFDTYSNNTTFGDLTQYRHSLAGCSDTTRGVFAGGIWSSTRYDIMDYITIQTTGNATDFGDLIITTGYPAGGMSNGTHGNFAGGYNGTSRMSNIQHITIQTTGNATDYGDLTAEKYHAAGCAGDP